MKNQRIASAGTAWYAAERDQFLLADRDDVVAKLASSAASDGWHIEAQQHQEWDASVDILQQHGNAKRSASLKILRDTLSQANLSGYSDVVLEYDFRRRGLRIDCVLLAPGIIAVLEFKRSKLTPADADQVTNYCLNLLEFHEETRRLVQEHDAIIVPILVQTKGNFHGDRGSLGTFHPAPWNAVVRNVLRCDSNSIAELLLGVLSAAKSSHLPDRHRWLNSVFSPSSTILDAAISLFGNHPVSAIESHAGAVGQIERVVDEVHRQIEHVREKGRRRIIFISGAPGAGKTLVGLRLAFSESLRTDAVFVTGNAPLVDVLSKALENAYRTRKATAIGGYPKESANHVIRNSTFKLVKAHNFLGQRGSELATTDGSVVIFDEAQRTYEEGKRVLGNPLEDHEADLILKSLSENHPAGTVVIALLGQNQAINRGERGLVAWLEAADRQGWQYAISDETLDLDEITDPNTWRRHPSRRALAHGHLASSMRFYRNEQVESWVHHVVEGEAELAAELGFRLHQEGHTVWVTRDLADARAWARAKRVGEERIGLIASGQGRRLAAEGLFVDHKPSIAQWMLSPTGDIRSSNQLETVQNQYQIQGLELDYTVVCWDADLRHTKGDWEAWKIHGSRWQRDPALSVAKNSYRVLLTRARKGMVIFVPTGDLRGDDETRRPEYYDGIASYLLECGARPLDSLAR